MLRRSTAQMIFTCNLKGPARIMQENSRTGRIMSDPKALAFSGLTQYRFRERGSGAIHNVSIDGLSTKQWRRFAQQLDSSRADFFRKSYRRFMGELADCQAADAADLVLYLVPAGAHREDSWGQPSCGLQRVASRSSGAGARDRCPV